MPDAFGFTHEPHWGVIYHRCIWCDLYPWGAIVSETERKRHHTKHEAERKRRLESDRKANLRLARKAKRTYEKENG